MARVRENRNEFQQWCIENGYTAEKVAKLVGISPHTVYSYYRGERLPSRRTMQKMEEALGIDAKEMF